VCNKDPGHPDSRIVWDGFRRALAESTDLEQIMGFHQQAEAICQYIKIKKLGLEMLNQAGQLKLLVERRAGKVLPDLGLHGGDHKSSRQTERSRLKTWGISRNQSYQWRKVAELSEEDVAWYVGESSRRGEDATSYGLFRLAKTRAEMAKLAGSDGDPLADVARGLCRLVRGQKRFACIYVDPPSSPPGKGRAKRFPLHRGLVQLPVGEVVAPRAHLYLKVAPGSREDGKKVLRAWGFSLAASLSRTKTSLEPRDVLQSVRDILLLGVHNESGCDNHRLPHWFEREEVLKGGSDEALFRFIEKVSPSPYLDLFGCQPISKRWTIAAAQ